MFFVEIINSDSSRLHYTLLKKSFILFFFIAISLANANAQQKNLAFFLNSAKQNSPLLNDFNNQLLSNKIDSLRFRANNGFQVNASTAGLYAPVIKGYGYDFALSNGQSFNALMVASKPIIGNKGLNTILKGINLQADSIRLTQKISERDLQRNIAAQYILAYADQEQKDFSLSILDLLRKENELLRTLTQNSVYKQTDYLTFLVTLQQAELQFKQINIQFKTDYSTLNYLCGIADTTISPIEKPILTLKPKTEIYNSIFLKTFENDSLKLLNNKNLVDFTYRPKGSIFADGGYNSSFAIQPYKNFGTSLGFTFSMPIYDGKQRKMQYNRLVLAEQTRTAYKNFFLNQYQQQLAQLNRQLAETNDLYIQINEKIKFTKSLILADGKLMQTGDLRISDYVLAINNYMDAQTLLRQTNINRLQIINQLNYWNN
jgi:hypothetical protein